jgi:hypothetical protein
VTRTHRRWHFWLWLALGPLLAAGFAAGLLAYPVAGEPNAAPQPWEVAP